MNARTVVWATVPFLLALPFFTGFAIVENGFSGAIPSRMLQNHLFPPLQRVSAFFTDMKFRWRGTRSFKETIAVVEIDTPSIERLGRWPWRRDATAYLIEQTFTMGARAVGTDILFPEPETRVPEELVDNLQKRGLSALADEFATDPKLARTILRHSDQLVMSWVTESPCRPAYSHAQNCAVTAPVAIAAIPATLDYTTIRTTTAPNAQTSPLISALSALTNWPLLAESAKYQGFANAFRDPDGVLRRAGLVIMVKGKPHPSLPLELARLALDEDLRMELDEQERVRSLVFAKSGRVIPITPLGSMEINFRGPERTINYVSAADVLDGDPVAAQKLKGAIALIGVSAAGLAEMTPTPFDSSELGLEIHATLLDNLMGNDMMIAGVADRHAALIWMVCLLLMLVAVPVLSLASERLSGYRGLGAFAGFGATVGMTDFHLLFGANRNWNTGFLYLEMLFLAVFSLVRKFRREEREKRIAQAKAIEHERQSLIHALENARMEEELEMARLVQSTILTPPQISCESVDIHAHYVPSTECSGDIWDASLDGDSLKVLIGDATGHGAPAAIVTAVTKSCLATLHHFHKELPPPHECLETLNRIIHSTCQGQLLITMCFMELNRRTGELWVANAGHEMPLCLRNQPDGKRKVEALFCRGERLGFHAEVTYRSERHQLGLGDTLLLYTDGLTDAENPEGKAWGERALRRTLLQSADAGAAAIKQNLVDALSAHAKDKPQHDDVTFVLLSWKGGL